MWDLLAALCVQTAAPLNITFYSLKVWSVTTVLFICFSEPNPEVHVTTLYVHVYTCVETINDYI